MTKIKGVKMLTLVYLSYFLLFVLMSSLTIYVKDCLFSDSEIKTISNDGSDWISELLQELENSLSVAIKKISKKYSYYKNIAKNKKIQYLAKIKKYVGWYHINHIFN